MKNSFLVAVFSLFFIFSVSCVSDEAKVQKTYIGLKVEDARDLAKKNEAIFRVIQIDGRYLAATMDYVEGRINARVKDGIVVDYSVEGQ